MYYNKIHPNLQIAMANLKGIGKWLSNRLCISIYTVLMQMTYPNYPSYTLYIYNTYYVIHMNLNYGIFQQIITKFVFHNIDEFNLKETLI